MSSTNIFWPPVAFHNAGFVPLTIEILGQLMDTYISAGPIPIRLDIFSRVSFGTFISAGPIPLTIVPKSSHFVIESVGGKCNWVKWSKIGSLDFTIDESNIAGERPLDWFGCVSEILKLGKGVVCYGTNGVSMLTPAKIGYTEPSVHMSMQTIHRIGVLCKPVGNENEHYFIDNTRKLFKLTGEGMQLLDYSEYLVNLTNPVMTFDNETGLLYICDGTYGYVYSTRFPSFGIGPNNVSGLGVKGGTLYVTAPDTIEVPKLHITTDIYDMGTRKPKTIQWIEIGTDLTVGLQARIETRISNKDDFMNSKWILVNPNGIAYIPCYGVEFRFQLKSFIYEYMEIDYIKVSGVVHGSSMLEQIQ